MITYHVSLFLPAASSVMTDTLNCPRALDPLNSVDHSSGCGSFGKVAKRGLATLDMVVVELNVNGRKGR